MVIKSPSNGFLIKEKLFSKKILRWLDYLAEEAESGGFRTLRNEKKTSCYPCRLLIQLRTIIT